MTFAAGRALDRISPMAGAISRPTSPLPLAQETEPPDADPLRPELRAGLTARLDSKLAEIEKAGFEIRWLEMGQREMLALFREGGPDAIRLDPEPARDCGWYGRYEVRHTGRDFVWIMIEGEVPGEISAHVID